MVLLSLSVLVALLSPTLADYTCFCSYATDTILYSQQSSTSSSIGHMYEFDCKPEYTDASLTAGWKAVMIDHHVGYFQKVSAVSSEICQGSIPSEDKGMVPVLMNQGPVIINDLTTGPPTTPTTPNSTTTSTSTPSTTAPISTTTSAPISTTTSTTKNVPTSSINKATTDASLLASTFSSKPISSTLRKISNVPNSSVKTTAASSSKSTSTTKIPTAASKLPTNAASTTPSRPSPSTSRTTTSTPSMVTSTPMPSTRKTTTQRVTATTRTTRTTKSTQPPPATHKITQAPFVTQPPKTTYKCPDNVVQAAFHNQGFTRVYGSTCYELVPGHYHWYDAEANCKHKGGHLVHVQNMAEENNVMQFLYDHGFKHAVWIGLTDLNSENYFHWTSGDPVTFTKWMPGHVSNFANHHYEDCVVLVPYIKAGFFGSHGLWDDIPCDDARPWICQYDAQPVHSQSGHIFGPGFFNHGHTTKSNHIVFTTKTPVIGGLAQALDIIGKK